MEKINFACFVHILCLILVLTVSGVSSKLCGDPECKTPIAKARVMLQYMGGGNGKLNLRIKDVLDILARDIGKNKELLVRNSKGEIGLASPTFIRESKILVNKGALINVEEKIVPSETERQQIVDNTTIQLSLLEDQQIDEDVPVPVTEATPALANVPSHDTVVHETINTGTDPSNQQGHSSNEKLIDNEVSEATTVNESTTTLLNTETTPSGEQNQSIDGRPKENTVQEKTGPALGVQAGDVPTPDPNKNDAIHIDNMSKHEASTETLPEHTNVTEPITGGDSEPTNEIILDESELEQSAESDTIDDDDEEAIDDEDEESESDDTEASGIEDMHEVPDPDSVDPSSGPSATEMNDDHGKIEDAAHESTTEKVMLESIDATTEASIETTENLRTEETSKSEETQTDKIVFEPHLEILSSHEIPLSTNEKRDEINLEAQKIPKTAATTTNELRPVVEEPEAVTVNPTIAADGVKPETPETVTENPIIADGVKPETPESITENPTIATDGVKPETDRPQAPYKFIQSGLGSLLAHSHHHHHHHHHNHGHHHHNHQHVDSSQELTNELTEEKSVPFIGQYGQEAREDSVHSKLLDNNEPRIGQEMEASQDTVTHENGYCDRQPCPHPNPAQTSPQLQQSNGFHHQSTPSTIPAVDAMTTEPPAVSPPAPQPQPEEQPFEHDQGEVDYAKMIISELFKLSDLILLLGITSFTLIVFSLGHYLINKNRKEKPLIYKLNMIERDLMASHKENAMLKADLLDTKHKLISIENNSFGSNDMVIALRQELEDTEQTKLELQEQIASLEKELENAAEAGLELNKMVAELLNQSGSESIALTVDELQRQLNEQQQTILSMNTTLADKSRENSELQVTLANQSAKFGQEMDEMQQTLNDLKLEKNNLEIELNNFRSGQNSQLDTLRKEASSEIAKLNKEVKSFQFKWEESKKLLAAAEAKSEALEECIKEIKRGNSNGTVDGLIDSAELKAQVAVLIKEKANLKEQLQGEIVARQLLDDHVKIINEEISALKKEYSQSEKDKLEAETRLEVLSSYFKDKETQLQKELSIKEAMWMQQQGETTSTVERIRLMQDEIQQLNSVHSLIERFEARSQNDKLRAEIEAQAAAHKTQYTALETRSHDAWLAARQAERRLEEARNESSSLRRKLTALGDVSTTNTTTDAIIPNTVPQVDLSLAAPSPLRVESPNAPMMVLPPPPFHMPPPFGPPFMPPFMPPPGPGEMRPAPLGRLMSPSPIRYSPSLVDSRDRYSPDRGRYLPDSRYDYSVMSNYETETDFSPPPSPPPHSRRNNYDREQERDRERDRDRDRDRERERDRDRDRERERDRDLDMRDRERDLRERDGRTSGSGGVADRSGGTGGGYPKAFSPPVMRTTSPPIQDPRNKKYQAVNQFKEVKHFWNSLEK
ncbi:transport and Golgi organization protein 1 isoform X2 [Toxorhynchites rutilus septentrionalis]|uniref:transport and Golgi organization protein 1 isoform X2 n=1 Tax=Toxorhynchites rutilus septentrionalis TaxID=329112 RepID=UPI00247AAFDC|nr:transport and Golgi organization protein 1 isoform X2 [Toxorhynchites rutilus septentrionalis]